MTVPGSFQHIESTFINSFSTIYRSRNMSRLEQMRQNFLQRIYNEQQQHQIQLLVSNSQPSSYERRRSSSLASARSVHNIPNTVSNSKGNDSGALQMKLKRSPSMFQPSLQGVKSVFDSNRVNQQGGGNISRVKSLNNVCLVTTVRSRTASRSVNGKQQPNETTKRNSTLNVNMNCGCGNDSYARKANSARVNRPTRSGGSHHIGSRVLSATQPTTASSPNGKRDTANNETRNELQCKHCDRHFVVKERFDKHVDICARTFHKQRTVFNSASQRLQEHNLNNADIEGCRKPGAVTNKIQLNEKATPKKHSSGSDWKNSRQQFLNAIKDARRLHNKAHLIEDTSADSNDSSSSYCSTATTVTNGGNYMSCSHCKRTFGTNVIVKHETICVQLIRKNI